MQGKFSSSSIMSLVRSRASVVLHLSVIMRAERTEGRWLWAAGQGISHQAAVISPVNTKHLSAGNWNYTWCWNKIWGESYQEKKHMIRMPVFIIPTLCNKSQTIQKEKQQLKYKITSSGFKGFNIFFKPCACCLFLSCNFTFFFCSSDALIIPGSDFQDLPKL